MLDLTALQKKMDDFNNSPEGKDFVEKYLQGIIDKTTIYDSQLQRAYDKWDNRFEEIVDRIIHKYNTEEYVNRWYKRSIEPPENLLFFVYDYVRKFGESLQDQDEITKYANMFTGGMYKYKGYIVQIMYGQGSVIRVDKI